MERQTWWAAGTVIVTIILAVAGGTWTIGRQMATRENLAELRTEIRTEIEVSRTEMQAEIQTSRTEMQAEMQASRTEMQAEFQAMRTATEEQMRELRGFIVQHLNGHAQPDD